MKILKRLGLLAMPPLLLLAGPVMAQPADEADEHADVTMTVLDEGEAPEEAFSELALPDEAADEGVTNSADGLNTANAARADGRAFGEATAEEAQNRGDESAGTAEEGLSQARDSIRDAIARGALENVPDEVRDNIPEDVIPDEVPVDPPVPPPGG